VPKERVSSRIAPKIAENQELVTILNIHEDIDYGTVDVVLDQLKEAKAFKITFATEFGG
jgi:biopolymer transport protein ExbD